MKELLTFAVMAALVAAMAWGAVQRGEATEARERAQTAEDSIAALVPALEAAEAAAATQDTLVGELRAALDSVRAETDTVIVRVQGDQSAAVDSALALADSATAVQIRAFVVADSLEDAAYEHQINALEVTLGAVTRQAELNREGWDAERALRIQETVRADAWERVANPPLLQRLMDRSPWVLGGAAVVAGVLILR